MPDNRRLPLRGEGSSQCWPDRVLRVCVCVCVCVYVGSSQCRPDRVLRDRVQTDDSKMMSNARRGERAGQTDTNTATRKERERESERERK